jgi:RsiW-degrading membrane proteinase PrsW (M82 family)
MYIGEKKKKNRKRQALLARGFLMARHTHETENCWTANTTLFLFSIPLYSYITYISLVRYQMENIVTRADGRCAFEPLISPVVNQKKEDK